MTEFVAMPKAVWLDCSDRGAGPVMEWYRTGTRQATNRLERHASFLGNGNIRPDFNVYYVVSGKKKSVAACNMFYDLLAINRPQLMIALHRSQQGGIGR